LLALTDAWHEPPIHEVLAAPLALPLVAVVVIVVHCRHWLDTGPEERERKEKKMETTVSSFLLAGTNLMGCILFQMQWMCDKMRADVSHVQDQNNSSMHLGGAIKDILNRKKGSHHHFSPSKCTNHHHSHSHDQQQLKQRRQGGTGPAPVPSCWRQDTAPASSVTSRRTPQGRWLPQQQQ